MARAQLLSLIFLILVVDFHPMNTHADTSNSGQLNVRTQNRPERIQNGPLSGIRFRAFGGRSPVKEYGFSVEQYPQEIVIRTYKIWYNGQNKLDVKERLSIQEYEALWMKLEKLGVWNLKEVSERWYFDTFKHEFIFSSQDGKTHKVETTELEGPLWEIVLLLNALSEKELGIKLYNDERKKLNLDESLDSKRRRWY